MEEDNKTRKLGMFRGRMHLNRRSNSCGDFESLTAAKEMEPISLCSAADPITAFRVRFMDIVIAGFSLLVNPRYGFLSGGQPAHVLGRFTQIGY